MAVIYNNTTVEEILYNGGGVKSLNVNGINVYEKTPDYMEYLNATTISQSDFMTKVCMPDTFSDINPSTNLPYAKDFIGKTITGITNTYNSSSNVDWEIIEYNSDSTTGTFDLMAKSSVKDSMKFRNTGGTYGAFTYNHNYEYSAIRTWLQSYVENFSSTNSTLYDRLVTMDIVYNFNTNQPENQNYDETSSADDTTGTYGAHRHTIQDKIKLLSITELGYTRSDLDYPYAEGTIYSNKFSSNSSTSADSNRIRNNTSGSATTWWTRSRYATSDHGASACTVTTNGQISVGAIYNSYSVVPVIRVKVVYGDYREYAYYYNNITISDFLNNIINSNVFTDNRADLFIGKTITGIANTYDSAYNVDWEIIGYNHDGSSNTFDLMAKSSIKDSVVFRDEYTLDTNQNYEFSTIRTWLQSYVNNFSSTNSNLYSHLATMDVVYNFNTNQPTSSLYDGSITADTNTNTTGSNKHTIQDKIKLLSGTELGYSGSGISYMPDTEGSRYSSKFSNISSNISSRSNMILYSGSSNSVINWWTRSRCAESSRGHYVWAVNTNGTFSKLSAYGKNSVVPVIRISV